MADQEVLKDKDDEEELIVVEKPIVAKPDGEEADGDEDGDEDGAEAAKDDDRRIKRVEGDRADETPEQRAERHRREKKERKERKEAAMRRRATELNFLRKQNDLLERRLSGIETHVVQKHGTELDTELSRAQQQLKMSEEVMAKAIAAGNGEDAAKAMRFRDDARDKLRQLTDDKQRFTQTVAEQRQQPAQPAQPDPMVVQYAKKFAQDNPWYDVRGANEDSAIMLAIDRNLAAEGYDPQSEDYWKELTRRGKKRLPERFKTTGLRDAERRDRDLQGLDDDDDDDDEPAPVRKPKGGPALGSGRDAGGTGGNRREIYINPARKQAMIDAGVWDDPVLRARYVKKYAEYDKLNPPTGR